MELRGPIAECFLALMVILAGIHEGGAILGEPGQLVKFLGTSHGRAVRPQPTTRTGRADVRSMPGPRNRTGWASSEQECSRLDAQKPVEVGTTH